MDKIKGIVIFSGSNDLLGRALTNPTHFNPKNPNAVSIKRGGLKEYSFLDGGIYVGGLKYKDVEHAYHVLGVNFKTRNWRKVLIKDLIKVKFTQYPELINDIQKRGGLPFLEKCIHTYNANDDPETFQRGCKPFSSYWTSSNKEDLFMRCLKQAYKEITMPNERT